MATRWALLAPALLTTVKLGLRTSIQRESLALRALIPRGDTTINPKATNAKYLICTFPPLAVQPAFPKTMTRRIVVCDHESTLRLRLNRKRKQPNLVRQYSGGPELFQEPAGPR